MGMIYPESRLDTCIFERPALHVACGASLPYAWPVESLVLAPFRVISRLFFLLIKLF